MAVPFSNTKLRVPKGFQNILEGLAREVLRSQPENVYEFGASYFESLLRTRTGKWVLCWCGVVFCTVVLWMAWAHDVLLKAHTVVSLTFLN